MGLGSIARKAKGKVENLVLGKILGTLLTKAAEGDFGSAVKALYWFTAGHKTTIGAVLAAVAAGLEALKGTFPWAEHAAHIVGMIAAFIATLGQVDGALRMPAPEK